MNPLRDRERGGDLPKYGASVEPVHEEITHTAIACADASRDADPTGTTPLCQLEIRQRTNEDPGNLSNALIVGVWWNDDPQQLLFRDAGFFFLSRHASSLEIANRFRERGEPDPDPARRHLYYRSHFGDLQFLHAMANRDNETPQQTQQRIIDWMRFAYLVATEQIAAEVRLGQLESPIRELFVHRLAYTNVGQLFRSPRMTLPVSGLALGSMLHLVQDSYAAGHARRAFEPSQRCRLGRVTQFHSYLNQDEGRHGREDLRSALQQGFRSRFTPLQNPLEASTRLILFVRQRADWATEVEPYLRETLFCVDDDAEASGPGRFQSALGRAFEIARTTECDSMDDIRRRLWAEGHSGLYYVNRPAVRRRLLRLCRAPRP